MLTNQELADILRHNNFKVTPQRLAIYQTLTKMHNHPTAEVLFNKLHPDYPSMSLATVYKSVDILKQIGVIRTVDNGEDAVRYDSMTSQHHHVQCRKCGKIFDVMKLHPETLIKEASKESGVKIESEDFYFYGLCSTCR